jgi:peptide/nickel transport system substrate-binding protein
MSLSTLQRRSRLAPIVALLAAVVLLLGACGNTPNTAQPQPAAAPATPAILTVSVEQQASWVRNFNPLLAEKSQRWPARAGIYEPLMIYNTMTGEYVPWLATEYKWSPDNQKLTLTTRDGVKWSDGQPFTAKDVVFTFELLKKVKEADLNGVWSFVADVKATDDKTVEFTFQKAYVPGMLFIVQQPIIAEHVWKDIQDPIKYADENPVATGPFTVIKTFQNQIYELGRNPNYWQAGKPYIDGLRFPAYTNNDAAMLATINGENDWAGNFINEIDKVFVAKDPAHNSYWFPAVNNDVALYLNTTKAPFDQVDVRKAISMAIDREKIVQVAMNSYTKPADGTGLSEAYAKAKNAEAVAAGEELVKLDAVQANALLDKAGFKKGADGVRVMPDGKPMKYDINVVTGWTDWVATVQIISRNLKDIGIDATVKPYDFSAWFDRVRSGNYDISIGWVNGPTDSPYRFYRNVMAGETVRPIGEQAQDNWGRFSSDQLNPLFDQYAATSDPAVQKRVGDQLQLAFVENLPVVPLFPGPIWAEYNTTHVTNFPSQANPYALPTPNNPPEYLLVLTELKPAK